jgi:hypothetical protein
LSSVGEKNLRLSDGHVPVIVFDGREETWQVAGRFLPRLAAAQQAPGQRVVFGELMVNFCDQLILIELLPAGEGVAPVRRVGQRHKGVEELTRGRMNARRGYEAVGNFRSGLAAQRF